MGLAKYALLFTTHFELKFIFYVKLKVRPTRLSGVIVCIGKPVLRKTFRVQVFDTFLWQRFASSVASIFGRLLVNDGSPSLLAMRSQRILMSPSIHSKLVILYYCHEYCSLLTHIVASSFSHSFGFSQCHKHCQGPMYLRVVRIQRISDVNFTTRQT